MSGETENGTVIIWQSCRFCSRSPILMVARRGDREGDSHHLAVTIFRSFRQSPFRHGVRGIPSQQSGSTVVHLEVFTSRATVMRRPYTRFIDPTARWDAPSAPVPLPLHGGIEHNLRKSAEICGSAFRPGSNIRGINHRSRSSPSWRFLQTRRGMGCAAQSVPGRGQ